MKFLFQKINGKILLVLIVVGFVLGIYASFVEPFLLRVTRYDFQTEKWPYDKPLTVALISDIHMVRPWMTAEHLQTIVDKANALNPDMILLLGDYVETSIMALTPDPYESLLPLKNLTPRCGTYAILGNHDMYVETRDWPLALAQTGVPVFTNNALSVECDGQSVWITGIDEMWMGAPDIAETLAVVNNDNPVIMMVHNPDLFVHVPDRVMMTVAGHTHGGQVRFPIIGAVAAVIPSRYGDRFAYGHIVEQGRDLFVTAGVGMTGLPVRFMNRPEIALITIHK